jgi:hypothetical protein
MKTIVQGEFTRYKAKVVAKGYSQTYGVNHDENFKLIMKYDFIFKLF